MKIVLIIFVLFGNYLSIYSQNIIINYHSVSSQYEDYVILYNDKVKDIYYSLTDSDTNIRIPKIGINELSFKIVPSTSPQVIRKIGDTIFITLIIDYRILPKFVYVFHGQDLLAIMDRHRLGYGITQVVKGSAYANYFECIKNDKKDIIFWFCPLDKFLKVEEKGFKYFLNCSGNYYQTEKNEIINLYNYLINSRYHPPCDQSNDPIILPGLKLDSLIKWWN